MPATAELLDAILRNVEVKPAGCWLWFGGMSPSGTPRLHRPDGHVSPRRILYETVIGPAPARLQRTCSTLRCVSPHHSGIRPPPPPAGKPVEESLARALRRQGYTLAVIATLVGVRRIASVHRWVHEPPVEPLPVSGPWWRRAACRGTPTQLWFTASPSAACLALCERCGVRAECAEEAERPGTSGTWAGEVHQYHERRSAAPGAA